MYEEMKANPVAERFLEEMVARKEDKEMRALRNKTKDKNHSKELEDMHRKEDDTNMFTI